jgi:hypothetical protein
MKTIPGTDRKMTADYVAKNINNWRDRDAEMVTGIFKNNENPGMALGFNYRAYPNDEFRDWHFEDGQKYTIPRGIARHLNNACYTKEYAYLPGESGKFGVHAMPSDGRPHNNDGLMATRKVHRFSFQSLEFQDDDLDMIPSKIIEVTKDIK